MLRGFIFQLKITNMNKLIIPLNGQKPEEIKTDFKLSMSWDMLIGMLGNQLRPYEQIDAVVIDDTGLDFIVSQKKGRKAKV